jgi:hypothetical protein
MDPEPGRPKTYGSYGSRSEAAIIYYTKSSKRKFTKRRFVLFTVQPDTSSMLYVVPRTVHFNRTFLKIKSIKNGTVTQKAKNFSLLT